MYMPGHFLDASGYSRSPIMWMYHPVSDPGVLKMTIFDWTQHLSAQFGV